MLTLDEKLDEALKETFPASDAFFLSPAPSDLGLAHEPDKDRQATAPSASLG